MRTDARAVERLQCGSALRLGLWLIAEKVSLLDPAPRGEGFLRLLNGHRWGAVR
jgi:hypothetical protein